MAQSSPGTLSLEALDRWNLEPTSWLYPEPWQQPCETCESLPLPDRPAFKGAAGQDHPQGSPLSLGDTVGGWSMGVSEGSKAGPRGKQGLQRPLAPRPHEAPALPFLG